MHHSESKDFSHYSSQDKDYQHRGIPLNTNVLSKSKKAEQSEFRVHFYLKNVYYKESDYQTFIHNLSNRITKVARVHLIQISHFIDERHVDVSIGLQRDIDALKLLTNTQKKILLYDQNGELKQWTPIASAVFQSFIEYHKHQLLESFFKARDKKNSFNENSIIDRQSDIKLRENEEGYYQSKKVCSQMEIFQTNRNNVQNQPSLKNYRSYECPEKKQQVDTQKQISQKLEVKQGNDYEKMENIDCLWIFGVPMQYSKRDVITEIQQKKIDVLRSKWMFLDEQEQTQFLLVDLKCPISISKIESLNLRISYYPLICIQKQNSFSDAMKELAKYQIQVKFKKQSDYEEEDIIFFADKCGQVLVMIYTEIPKTDQYSVIIVYNSKKAIRKITTTIEREFKECTFERPKEPLKVGRTYKQFSFEELVEGLTRNNTGRRGN